MKKSFFSKAGFTLVEMSIVLVIIGFLAGGILLGRSLIQQASLRAVMQEYDQYVKSVGEFQNKYLALPGDMSTADDLWGSGAACGGASSMLTTNTCSGDGDGLIGNCDAAMSCTDAGEIWLAWQHLSNARLIDGRYSGSATGMASVIGTNAPASSFTPGSWSVLYYTADATLWTAPPGHILMFGGVNSSATTEPILFAQDALDIDLKMDDGLPKTGMIRAWANSTWGAASANCISGTQYETCASDACKCSLAFFPGF